jgi:hypothetical protein
MHKDTGKKRSIGRKDLVKETSRMKSFYCFAVSRNRKTLLRQRELICAKFLTFHQLLRFALKRNRKCVCPSKVSEFLNRLI